MEDEVVISGVGGRFPQCDNLQDYRDKLLQNLHLLTDDSSGEMQQKYTAESPPLGNAPTIRSSGSINRREKFDHTFFGMHTRLAAATDTVTHLILETALEAVIDAGYSPKDLQGTNTAVFMGYHCNESSRNVMGASEDGLSIMGINAAMAANRVSYWLDLKGTSFTHNTQLVSGMQSLDMAFQALARGECERAIVGAAALTCWEELTAQYDGLGWISRTGTCKPFDRAADGSVRSDSVVVMFLERRRTARRAYAEVVHSASALFSEACQSGLPNIERRVIGNILRDFYRECGVDPERIAYVEADGWGVSDVDEAEVGALDDVIASRRKHPLLIGSVKGNIGTTEAASGLASVCKALVALESGTIPATLNHINPNPRIAGIAQGRMQVVTKNTPLAPGLVAVNSLGFGGYLGHVLLKPNSREKKSLIPAAETIPRLLLLSGRTTEGLESIMKLAEANAMDPEYVHLVHSVFSSNIAGHVHRGYSIVPRADPSKPAQTQFYSGQKRPVWFIYSGMGSQWAGMGADLLRVPVFAAAVERCHEVLLPHGLDLKHIITTTDATIFDNVLNAFVGIAAVQIGLTDVLRSVGVEPVGMVGHSVGELGCAYADGCLTAEQTIMAAYARGVASNEADLVPGMMAAVGLGHLSVKAMLPESIEIACHNSASSCTLSGPAADMNVFVEKLKDQGFFARAVNVSNIAYHSRYIRPAAPRLLELLKGVIVEPKKRSSRWISTSVQPAQAGDYDAQYATAQYFTNNLLSSVYFEESCHEVDDDALAIEIAPHGLLQAILKRSLSEDAVNVALTKRGEPGVTQLLGAFGRLYMEGLNPDVAKLYPPVATPVCRDTKPLSPLATWDHSETWPILSVSEAAEGTINTELLVPLALTSPELSHLAHCTWNGHALLSPATCLSLVLSVVTSNVPEGRTIVLDNIIFYDSLVVPEEGDDEVDVVLHTGTGRFELSVRGRLVCSGRSAAITEQDEDPVGPDVAVPQEDRVLYDADDLYEELGRRGLQCGGALRGIMSLQMGSAAVLGSASYDADKECVTALELETLMQVAALQQYGGRRVLHVPKRIQKVVMNPSKALPSGSTATLRHDVIRRRLCLHSPRGRLDVLQADMRAVPLPPTLAPILVHSRAFLSLTEGAAADLSHLCSLALQVAAQQARGPVLVASVPARGSSSSALHAAVDSVAHEQLTDLHVRVESVADVGDTAALVVSDAAGLQAATAAARRQRGMVLAELPKGFTAPADLKQLLSVEQGGRRYALLKYSVDVDQSSEVLLAADQLDVTLTRLALCHAAKVYVVFREVAPQAVAGLVRTLSAAPGSGRAHFVFLEKASPAFALDAPVYAAQLRLGLRVNMLRGERWGWEYRVHVAKLDAGSESGRGARQDRFIMDALKVTYLGVHQRRDAEDADDGRPELLDYAGVRPDGTRVMGVCVTGVGSLQPDPVLAWTVPSAWKDQAAATVPLVYATAALAVHEQLEVGRGKRVLVVDGASPLGLASISLLLRVGCRVVATAKNATEAAALRAQFRDGLDTVVGSTVQDCASRLSARARSKTCVDAVLCQGGSDVFDCVMDLVETNGSVVHVGDGLTDGSSLGMLVFLKSCSARSVSWDWPLKAREETKRFVRDTVQAAIADGTVQPLRRSTAPPGAVAESRRVVSAEGAAAAPLVDADRSCLVLGPAAKAVTLAEWLLSVGAREVCVVPSTSRAWLAPHLALLAQHYGATVRAMPPAEPQQLIKALGLPVGLVLALDVPAARVQALDAASRVPGCALAVLVEAALDMPALGDVVRRRKAAGFAGVVASVGGLHADVRAVPMGRVLLCAKDPAVHAVEVMQVGSGKDRDEGEDTSAAGLAELLPGSLEALERLGRSLRNDVHHALLPSLIGGAASRRNREVPPVFLVAGLCDSPSRELGPVARCMSVSAVAVSPPRAASTVEQAADAVAEAVLRAQPCGPYTVAGRGWGGCVALEAARRLARSADCYVTALLLDSSPDVLKPALNPLRSHASGMPAALLKYLLKLDPEVEQRVNRTAGWSAQVRVALGREDAVVEDALDCVLRRVQGLIDYRPAPRSPQDHKVAVTLVSNQPAHLKSATFREVLLELDTFALDAPVEDVLAVAQQSARAISAGVHVGRTPMLGQHSPLLASR